ncbi:MULTISPECIES: type VII secretion integral membrane protein EccD [unclassified Mycobacterium]|uniref:type VII secretion integral membrane protein EccD n=1 Tax=unclassified Mycobacterium TaxID=2642494 RepID=UPI0029C6D090|nr:MULTISPECIES: type VII secretion integral membrane protein EccD [unclassified Mycobacterium]
MTGVGELRHMQVVSAAPEPVRVSVLGGRTQLDVALPADVPVAAVLPELARLIGSRDADPDKDLNDRDERRTFWVLGRVDGGDVLAPDQTLRDAGITNGEVLRLSSRRALSPPPLYDDVVDAAARLNRAAYAAWNATAAGVMAFVGLCLCAAAWIFVLLADAQSPHRWAVMAGAAFTIVTMFGGVVVVHRVMGLGRNRELPAIATAVGLPMLALSGALGWVLAAPHGAYGLAIACAMLLVLTVTYYRVIGAGHWVSTTAAVVFAFGGLVFLGRAAGGGVEVLGTVAATAAALGCLAVPAMTTRLGRVPAPTVESEAEQRDHSLADPFTPTSADPSADAAMPSAEQVWARVRAAALTRAGMLTGLAAVVATGATVLMSTRPAWPAWAFALLCAAVLALRSRWVASTAERAALAVPATVLVVIACTQAQFGATPLRLAGVGVLAAVAVAAAAAGLLATGGRHRRWVPTAAGYLDYVTVAALLPVALWPLGVFDRLGF